VPSLDNCSAKAAGARLERALPIPAALCKESRDMNKCIIHIGMHKTGSTSIQHSLDSYSDDQFLYATLTNTPNHSLAMYSLFAADPGHHRLHRVAQRSGKKLAAYLARAEADLQRSIEATKGRTLVISGEGIVGLEPPEVVKLAERFRSQFDQVTIVGYVRPPAGFLSSALQQRIRGGAAKFDLARMYRNYRATFAKFDDAFGAGNVLLWKFDPASFPGKDVVRDFCARLDLPLPERRIVRLNDSLSRQVVGALYTHNKFAGDLMRDRTRPAALHRLGHALGELGADKFRLSPKIVQPILEENQDDIRWMEERLGTSLHEPDVPHSDRDIVDEDDLLRPDPVVAERLRQMLGRHAPAGVTGKTPQEIATLVHAVYQRARKRGLFLRWITGGRWSRLFADD
jgi:hypothetical protein